MCLPQGCLPAFYTVPSHGAVTSEYSMSSFFCTCFRAFVAWSSELWPEPLYCSTAPIVLSPGLGYIGNAQGSWYYGVAQSTHYNKDFFLAKEYTNLIHKLNAQHFIILLLLPLLPSTTKCAHLHTPNSHLCTPNNGVYPG